VGFLDPLGAGGGGALTLGRFGAGTNKEDGDGDGRDSGESPPWRAPEARVSSPLRSSPSPLPRASERNSFGFRGFFFFLRKWFC
jgi:hypothetical protein